MLWLTNLHSPMSEFKYRAMLPGNYTTLEFADEFYLWIETNKLSEDDWDITGKPGIRGRSAIVRFKHDTDFISFRLKFGS